ncbi:MAG TPA: acetoacetate decarboxylase family protein, partial [Acidimicrobiales bacterium]
MTLTRIRYGARTPEQLENREVQATSVGAWSTSLTASYLTDPDVVAAVLPQPLEPTDEPLVRVSVARVDLGRGMPPFGAGTFAVQARHNGTVGNYPLVMPMTTEQSVIGGRETFGEPKKLAEVTLDRDGDQVVGRVTRLGTTFIEVSGTVSDPLDVPDDQDRVDFYFKFLPAPDGKGFDAEPS